MPHEDVEVARATFAAFRARDFDAVISLLHPRLEVRPAIAGGPEGVVYHGPDGMRKFWNEIDAAWAEFRIEPQEYLDLDGEVLVLGQIYARGRGSGIALETSAGWRAVVRGHRLYRFQSFTSREAALEAAGLTG